MKIKAVLISDEEECHIFRPTEHELKHHYCLDLGDLNQR